MGASTKQITGDNKMTINFKVPEIKELQPRLLVMGIGGAGGNAGAAGPNGATGKAVFIRV